MHEAELLLLTLMVAVAGLSILARWVGVPYPILLVLGGLVLGFVPGMPTVAMPPELVLVLFLPPLLYWGGFFSSPRDLRADLRAISLQAVGLVLATIGAVAVTAHALVDGLPWAAAVALGAIVSPTDPLAATAIARRLGVPRRLVTLLEGESLVNDATALVAYRIAVAAAVGGSFVWWQAGVRFVAGAAGGVAVGLGVGWLVAEVRRRLDDPLVEIVVSVVTGYAAYLPADRLGASGVLAAVTAGLYVGWRAPELASPSTRLLGFSFWEVLNYLLNAVLFILVGLQLHPILSGVTGRSVLTLLGQAVLVSAVVIVVRVVWGFTVPYLIRALDRRPAQVARRAGPRERLVVGWSGMRGAVSLAAALALPLEGPAGQAFPQRNLIVFLTFGVIFATLVVQGLTLPALIRRLGVRGDDAEEREELHARLGATDAALARLEELAGEDWTREDTVERLRGLYDYRRRRLKARAGKIEDDGYEDRSLAYQRLVRELLEAQRHAIVRLRNQGAISSDVMHRVERDLDLEDSRLEI
ncbi:MAG TPA: Na+/H+ antiporter [Actinomycetes bacterium]|jgi:CPA1 family monovalent cation:H+ antiporter|nr:Na+/H+ antiporter [Actinomycetes bacterium]